MADYIKDVEQKPKSKKLVDYDFKLLTPTEYQCILTMRTDNRLIKTIFSRSMISLRRKHGITLHESVDANKQFNEISKFDVNPRFYNMLKILSGKSFKEVVEEVNKDKIEIMDDYVTHAEFMRNGEEWQINIKRNGNSIDKR